MSISSLKAAARPLKPVLRPILDWWALQGLPEAAKRQRALDRRAGDRTDPGAEAAINAMLDWIRAAQDNSASQDGGVARDYSLIKGWASSYPETTGYIIPTLIEQGQRRNDPDLTRRARLMLDWLLEIQFPEGGFQGGVIGQEPRVPVTFNTGQILMGLAAGSRRFGGAYTQAMRKAADWLSTTQDEDGCWRKHDTPFARPGDKSYETHVAWGLLEAARAEQDPVWGDAALRQVDWALTRQTKSGWMQDCCLSVPTAPLTHTLGYALRGILEAWRFSKDEKYLEAAIRLGGGMRGALKQDGFLPGRLTDNFSPGAKWACLTGSAQTAHCWLMLHQDTGEDAWFEAAARANGYVRARVAVEGPAETRGAVAGAFPVDGGYCTYEYPNWAAKFLIDSSQLEMDIRARGVRLAEDAPDAVKRA